MKNVSRNRYDVKGALEQGMSAEERFVQCAEARDWNITPSSQQSDIYDHIDYHIQKGDTRYDVEVKSAKKVNRQINYCLIWLEIRGVNNPGWLFGGKAHFVAFELFDHFMFVDRTKLIDFVDANVDMSKVIRLQDISCHEEIKYLTGSRRTTAKPDLLTIVDTWKLNRIRAGTWTKSDCIDFSKPTTLDELPLSL